MRNINGKINGDLCLNDNAEIHGMVTGTITVLSGVTLFLYGLCGKNLIVEKNAKTIVHGMVSGNIENRGGNLEVYGLVVGRVLEISGITLIDKNALIQNK